MCERQGTPAPAPAPVKHAKIRGQKIEIDEKVHFATGSSIIEADSDPLLTEIADIIIPGHDNYFLTDRALRRAAGGGT